MTVISARDSKLSLSRRRILQGVAWAAPAVVVATAAPAAAASGATIYDGPPSTEPAGSWIFQGDKSGFNDGMYDLKSAMFRLQAPPSHHPKASQGQNAPYDGTATITIALSIRMTAMDDGVPFFSLDPLNPFGGVNSITLSPQAVGWVLGASSYRDGVLTIHLVNSVTYTDFNSGRAIQNVYVNVPTTNKVNNRNKDGSRHMAVTFSSPSFISRTDDPLGS